MTSLHVDVNEAAKYVDIIPPTLLASLSHFRIKYKMATIIGLTYEDFVESSILDAKSSIIVEFMKFQGLKAWKELATRVQ